MINYTENLQSFFVRYGSRIIFLFLFPSVILRVLNASKNLSINITNSSVSTVLLSASNPLDLYSCSAFDTDSLRTYSIYTHISNMYITMYYILAPVQLDQLSSLNRGLDGYVLSSSGCQCIVQNQIVPLHRDLEHVSTECSCLLSIVCKFVYMYVYNGL